MNSAERTRRSQRRLLIVVNVPSFFLSHRLPIGRRAAEAGYEVHIATGPGEGIDEIVAQGFRHHLLRLSRTGTSPLEEIASFLSILATLFSVRPDVLHLVTIKPVLYGGIAARIAPVHGVVAAISGLGSMFDSRHFVKGIRQVALRWAYRVALGGRSLRVIFQNDQDRKTLIALTGLPMSKTRLLRGSGVDLALYAPRPETSGVPVMLFASRLLRSKGVGEFVEAARMLRRSGVEARFCVAGELDTPSPDAITAEELRTWKQEGAVELLGHRDDMPSLLASVHAVVLPSYYGEGVPKVLLEAASCARAVITTDHPGCRDAIVDGETGLLVPVRDVEALANAMRRLIENAEFRRNLGAAGRILAESEFSDERIADEHLACYAEVLDGRRGGR